MVDDSLSVRKIIEKHLVTLEKLRARPYALILTDLEMPRMHGFELVAEVRQQDALSGVPILVITSRDADKHRLGSEELGANGFIIKPFSSAQLAENVERFLGSASAR